MPQEVPHPADKHDPSMDMTAMMKVLMDSKVEGNKSVWAATLDTFAMADGKTHKGDIKVSKIDQGLELVRAYVDELERKKMASICWDLVPLSQFHATKDQLYLSFLKWAEKYDKDGNTHINVSKAIRRLDAYFQWMNENRKDLQEPLTADSIENAAQCWNIQITYDDKGHFLWWIDIGSLDRKGIQTMEHKHHLRYVVWFAHLVMFDAKAQEHGAMIIENLGHVGFWQLATLVPHDLSAKMDRLTIGILPVKMKAIYVFGAATWMHLLMAMMKPFMGKKMRERMILLPNKTDMQAYCDDLVSRKNIPKGFCDIQGKAPRDAVLRSFLSK